MFLVGTDTDCGKTTLACALLRAAAHAGLRALPFKPAASGPSGPAGDPERLAAASDLGVAASEICPLRYAPPLAPGIVDDASAFVSGPRLGFLKDTAQETGPIGHVRTVMEALEAAHRPDVTLVEGAGGLWVPMPGGTWLPAWIAGLRAAPIVVGRLGLGGVNHALLTIFALRALGLPPRGFFLVDTHGGPDAARAHNPAVIAAASGLPCLGVMPHAAADASWLAAEAWATMTGAAPGSPGP
ncbi:dethiobiotin synthase [Nannocystis exedens]|uniref:ATP-dependent dethiobiotin synthetase BioD n=1 Tax=Nannocystis exedens TaxID=54 RepID=A0A1I1U392_9BACT|nr:ATP-dependent dethiobiotin synthetase BioD [Nannocystis exedens]PCC71399.1 dethiobiotin synthase [Nannocystis exedens]SFD65331.1 dethiobiotin synthase [Nannocystis exedens]